mmetsp:Transcript_6700/g.14601  ORF Transcript_6700/g.14601 Transcript_6700/m.14601 type:complete len:471 (+) Transcript_6700:60-1472(+)
MSYQKLPGERRSTGPFANFRAFLAREIEPSFDRSGSMELPNDAIFKANSRMHNGLDANIKISKTGGLWRPVRPLQPGSVRTCALTLVATALGSGLLALPYAFSRVGVMLGVLALFVAGCFGSLSLNIIIVASRYTEATSYASLLALATGSKAAGVVLDGCLAIYGCAVLLALLIFEGDFVPAVLCYFPFLPNLDRTTCILIVAAAAWPLVLPSQVSALRYVAAFSPFAILAVAAHVMVHLPHYYEENSKTPQPVEELSVAEALQAASIFVFSVMCHMNAVPVAHMLDRPSVERIVKVTVYSTVVLWSLYLGVGIGGFLSFRSAVQGDFLLNYPTDSLSTLCCRIMMMIVCYVGIPMNSSPCSEALRKLIRSAVEGQAVADLEPSPFFHAFLASTILAGATVGAICFTNVAVVISLVGGSLTTLQMFWLPLIVYWKVLYPTHNKIFGIIVMTFMAIAGTAGFASVIVTVVG